MGDARGGHAALLVIAVLLVAAPLAAGQLPDAYLYHPPIVIESDADFDDPASGVVAGDGTEDDPYVIEGWLIDMDAPSSIAHQGAGIYVNGTSTHFVVRDVQIAGEQEAVDGIRLFHLANASVADVLVTQANQGVAVRGSVDVQVANATIDEYAQTGVSIDGSARVVVADVTTRLGAWDDDAFDFGGAAVDVDGSEAVTIMRAVVGGDSASAPGLHVSDSRDVMLIGNFVEQMGRGLRVESSGDVTVRGDVYRESRNEGAWLEASTVRLEDVVVAAARADGVIAMAVEMNWTGGGATDNGRTGVDWRGSDGAMVDVYIARNDADGVRLYGHNNLVYGNRFIENKWYGFRLSGPADGGNHIQDNQFEDNRLGDLYIEGRVGNNVIAGNNGTVERDYDVFDPAPGAGSVIVGVLAVVHVARRRR